MKIGKVLGRSFKALKSGTLWGFFATAVLAAAVPIMLIALLVRFVITTQMLQPLGMLSYSGEDQMLLEVIRLYAVLGFGMLFALPFVIIGQGGLIHLSDGVLAGRPVSIREGWSFGFRRFFRTLGVEFLTYLMYMIAAMVVMVPFFVLVVGGISSTAGNPDNPTGPILGICCGYLWFFVALILVALVYTAIRGLALRYALVGGRGAVDAVGSSFKAVRHAFKKVLVFALAMIGLMYAYQSATSIVLAPAYLFMMVPMMSSSTPDPDGFLTFMWVLYPLAILLYLPMTLFNSIAWTAYFRALTGIDTDIEAPPVAYAPAPPSYPPAPPMWTQPPAEAPPAPPVAAPPAPPAAESPAPPEPPAPDA